METCDETPRVWEYRGAVSTPISPEVVGSSRRSLTMARRATARLRDRLPDLREIAGRRSARSRFRRGWSVRLTWVGRCCQPHVSMVSSRLGVAGERSAGQFRLLLDPKDQSVPQGEKLLRALPVPIAIRDRMPPEARRDLLASDGGEVRNSPMESCEPHSTIWMRHVEDRNPLSRAAKIVPERLPLHLISRVAGYLVGPWLELRQGVNAVPCRAGLTPVKNEGHVAPT